MCDAVTYLSLLWYLEEQRGEGSLKSSFRVAMQATREEGRGGGPFYTEGELSLCNTAVLKLYCRSYWVL